MVPLKEKILQFIQKPWFVALLLFGAFLAVNGYKLGWDDQHLEIPLLKHLIDPALYAGDYYVESAKANFSSYFYPILAKLISVDQIPAVYFFLYLVSRYFLVYWIYKLWLHISQDRFTAVSATLVFLLMSRVHEFLYRTFSHQEFALAIIFAGIYFFFRERFFLAAVLLGVAANFHALYSLFPMFYMGIYLLWQIKKHGIKTLLMACGAFILAALPFVVWAVQHRLMGVGEGNPRLYQNWLELYYIACPQNFPFETMPIDKLFFSWDVFFRQAQLYLFLAGLFILNIVFNKRFRSDQKAIAFSIGAFLLLVACFVFAYAYPSRFVIDLNLIRNTQYLLFLLMGYTCVLCVDVLDRRKPVLALGFILAFVLIKYGQAMGAIATVMMACLLMADNVISGQKEFVWKMLFYAVLAGILGPLLYYVVQSFAETNFEQYAVISLRVLLVSLTGLFCVLLFRKPDQRTLLWMRSLLAVPLLIYFCQYTFFHFKKYHEENYSEGGFWSLQRSWEDMQRFVKSNTAKDAMILVPYNMEMGGFRIFSDRKIIASYRDCGIIGFDYPAAVEWQQRMEDIKPFKVIMKESPQKAIENAVVKYKADYIVFMGYAVPKSSPLLEKVYTNDYFALFKVIPNTL